MNRSNSGWWFLVACAVVLSQAALLSTPAMAHSGGVTSVPPNQCGEGNILDITHRLVPGMPSFGSQKGIGNIVTVSRGNTTLYGTIKLKTHTGTHIDAPGHFFENLLLAGFDVDYLNLQTLNGPVLVVDVPRDQNITEKALQSMNLPTDLKRVIFKTLNTDRGLMKRQAFESNYTGLTADGANWLVTNTQIKFLGIDYLSIAAMADIVQVHKILLGLKDIIPVEGLNLDAITPGQYIVRCLPLRLPLADGSPARCILQN